MFSTPKKRIQIVDSNTGGEPTRLVISGGPDLGRGSLEERREVFRVRFDEFRSAVVNEPRGSEAVVGALLCEPQDPGCRAGVIFFNKSGYLGMCGHGMIGLIASLAHLGRIETGEHRVETPVGIVTATLHSEGDVTVRNVPSYRHAASVSVDVPGCGRVIGDVAWGGNWFFLVRNLEETLTLANVDHLVDRAWRIRQALGREGITGKDGGEIDHIEFYGPPVDPRANSRNFVLCPDKSYDRSPCGTGTSAKMACLVADGELQPGEVWRQESIVGSVFEGSVQRHGEGEGHGDCVIPSIRGSAFVCAESTLLLHDGDPFRGG